MADMEVEPAKNSPFHPDNIGPFTLLTLLQCRDLLAGILMGVNAQGYEQIRAAHKSGTLVLEPPYLLPSGPQGEDEDAAADQ